jgi:hypothetical protein
MQKRKLFLANGTMQNIVHWFRDPATGRVRSVEVPNRRQVMVGEFTPQEENKMIRHLKLFGAAEAKEAPNLQTLFGLVYHVQEPMKSEVIDGAIERNRVIAQDLSNAESENAGVALFRTASREAQDIVKSTEMEVLQLDEFGSSPRKGGVNFAVEVSKRNQGRQEGRRRSAA